MLKVLSEDDHTPISAILSNTPLPVTVQSESAAESKFDPLSGLVTTDPLKLVQSGTWGMGVLAAINAPYRGAGIIGMVVEFEKIMRLLLRYIERRRCM